MVYSYSERITWKNNPWNGTSHSNSLVCICLHIKTMQPHCRLSGESICCVFSLDSQQLSAMSQPPLNTNTHTHTLRSQYGMTAVNCTQCTSVGETVYALHLLCMCVCARMCVRSETSAEGSEACIRFFSAGLFSISQHFPSSFIASFYHLRKLPCGILLRTGTGSANRRVAHSLASLSFSQILYK